MHGVGGARNGLHTGRQKIARKPREASPLASLKSHKSLI